MQGIGSSTLRECCINKIETMLLQGAFSVENSMIRQHVYTLSQTRDNVQAIAFKWGWGRGQSSGQIVLIPGCRQPLVGNAHLQDAVLPQQQLPTGIGQGPLVFGMGRGWAAAHDEGFSLVVMTIPLKGPLVVCASRIKINETETAPPPCLPAGTAAVLNSLPLTPSASAAWYKRSQD